MKIITDNSLMLLTNLTKLNLGGNISITDISLILLTNLTKLNLSDNEDYNR